MAQIDRKGIENYFKPFPKWAAWFIVLGVITIPAYGLGIVLIIIGILGLVLNKRPSDTQMDNWFTEESNDFQGKALSKCGVDSTECVAEPVVVWGPRIENRGNAPLLVKKGKDSIIRYNPVDVTIINFGADQLLCYQCAYDRTSGGFLMETTEEYFYRDVVSVATSTKSEVKEIEVGKEKKKVQSKSREVFQLTTSGGTSITVVLKDEGLIASDELKLKGGQMPTTQAEKAIQSVRRMLRDKKKS